MEVVCVQHLQTATKSSGVVHEVDVPEDET